MKKNCKYCDKEFTDSPAHLIRRKYCSRKCLYECLKKIPRNSFYKTATEEMKIEDLKKRFNKRVIKNEIGCWGWKGYLGNGYGRLKCGDGKYICSHRVSYLIHKGSIPEGMYICHTCDIKSCTNPDHLFLGTAQDNMTDKVKKMLQTHGEKNPSAKLTNKQVIEIRKLLNTLEYSSIEIGKMFNVSKSTVRSIKKNRIWKYIKE